MKIVLLINTSVYSLLPVSGEMLESGSWIQSYVRMLLDDNRQQLLIIAPDSQISKNEYSTENIGSVDVLRFSYENNTIGRSDGFLEMLFTAYLGEKKPDIIHIFGTEYSHSLSMYVASCNCGSSERVVVNMQGIVGQIARHYCDGLPNRIVRYRTFRDFLLRSSIRDQQKQYEKRAITEEKLLKKVNFAIGRTEWDRLCAKAIHPGINYFDCTELIRPTFFDKVWSVDNCVPHKICVSQASYPVKGLHFLLQALPDVVSAFPDTIVNIAGSNILAKIKYRDNSYTHFIRKQIEELGLSRNVVFVGPLSEEQMAQMYLSSNLYVLCSQIENESNSLSEAMLCGMPVIASYIGGVTGRIVHNVNGIFYSPGDTYMLSQQIKRIFSNANFAVNLGTAARISAQKRFNNQRNFNEILHVYESIIESER